MYAMNTALPVRGVLSGYIIRFARYQAAACQQLAKSLLVSELAG
jgi:hypothetical protein